jgi:hypothetical protein
MNIEYTLTDDNFKEHKTSNLHSLLLMAKDLYNLYTMLDSNNDLPEWCHYKLATSRKDLADVTDYLTSKIMHHCIDKNITQKELRLEIKKSMLDDVLSEGFFDLFKKSKKSKNPYEDEFSSSHRTDVSYNKGYVNNTLRFINLASELALKLRSITNDAGYMLDDNNMENYLIISIDMTRHQCIDILNSIQKKKPRDRDSNNVTSARINKPKKHFFKRMFEDYNKTETNRFVEQIRDIVVEITKYRVAINNNGLEKDVSNIMLYEKQKIELISKKLRIIIDMLKGFIDSYESRQNIHTTARRKD